MDRHLYGDALVRTCDKNSQKLLSVGKAAEAFLWQRVIRLPHWRAGASPHFTISRSGTADFCSVVGKCVGFFVLCRAESCQQSKNIVSSVTTRRRQQQKEVHYSVLRVYRRLCSHRAHVKKQQPLHAMFSDLMLPCQRSV